MAINLSLVAAIVDPSVRLLHRISNFYDGKVMITDAETVRSRIETIIRSALSTREG